jgi:ubiquinone/menaquinone biosynthesis C-methylase UbiE
MSQPALPSATGARVHGYVPPDALDRIADLTVRVAQRARERLALAPGSLVLDAGCGTGRDTLAMGKAVAPGGTATGIDIDPAMIELAQDRARQAGLDQQVRFVVADVMALPFDDNSFDACWSERMLQHLDDPGAALDEMLRVTRHGGRIAVADADWHTLSIHHPDTALERSFVAAVSAAARTPGAGRALSTLFAERGMTGVTVEVFPIWWTDAARFLATSLAVVDLADRIGRQFDAFLENLRTPPANGTFFAQANLVLVSAVKP